MPERKDAVTHEAIMERLERGDEKFDRLFAALSKIEEAVEPIPGIKEDVGKTKEIVEAWAAVKTVGRFMKWAASIIAAAGVLIVCARHAAAHLFKG